ncbi:MAG TPA: hypothetical protein VK731_12840 [Candidatus Cybelea sp.]|jgi:hypothetical protein|nr:hypothetical protein [Candidatus Cybelea sp.]
MRNPKIAEALRILALIAVVVVAWGLARDRLSLKNWQLPFQYEGDGLAIDAWLKSGSEGNFIPLVEEGSPRLNAPYDANWYDYPSNGKFIYFLLGMASKVIGFFPAATLGVVCAYVFAAISFYLCCRLLHHSPLWSFVGAVLFSLTYDTVFRNWAQLQLAYDYMLPFAMLSVWLIMASKRMEPGGRLAWICLGTSFMMGLDLPYYTGMYGQFLCFAMAAQLLGRRRKENLRIGAMSMGITVATFLVYNGRTLIYGWTHGKNSLALARNYFETELYALKPIEFFIPPPEHHIDALARIGEHYRASAWVKGEMFYPYLGLIASIGLVWMFVEMFQLLNRKPKQKLPRRFPAFGPQVSWIVLYSVIGGVNCMIGFCGFQLFRASNRYSIFVSLLALMFLVARMSVLTRRWSAGWKYGLAAAVLLIGLDDQLPSRSSPEEVGRSDRLLASDRAFGETLEEKLPHGAMVFQMPVMAFPEGLPIRDVSTYEMFRPYLFTKTIRFSYGAVRGRPREDWQYEVEKLPPAEIIATLEKYGFSALYLNRKCYADNGEGILKQCADAGRTEVINDEVHQQVCVVLKPSPHPELPHTDDRALITLGGGWSIKEQAPGQNRQWSDGNASLSFFNESKSGTAYSFKCLVGSMSPRRVSIQFGGKEIWNGQLTAGQAAPVDLVVEAKHGKNVVELLTDEKAVQPQDAKVELAFTVINLQIIKLSP